MSRQDRRNLNPTKLAVAAMYLFGSRYAAQRGGSMDFWDSLPAGDKNLCRELIASIAAARKEME